MRSLRRDSTESPRILAAETPIVRPWIEAAAGKGPDFLGPVLTVHAGADEAREDCSKPAPDPEPEPSSDSVPLTFNDPVYSTEPGAQRLPSFNLSDGKPA